MNCTRIGTECTRNLGTAPYDRCKLFIINALIPGRTVASSLRDAASRPTRRFHEPIREVLPVLDTQNPVHSVHRASEHASCLRVRRRLHDLEDHLDPAIHLASLGAVDMSFPWAVRIQWSANGLARR